MRTGSLALLAVLPLLLAARLAAQGGASMAVGSKAFPESWILGEALARLAASSGEVRVENRQNLGGTEIVYKGLQRGDIDVYPEYTGTVAEVILKLPGRPSLEQLRRGLAADGIGMSDSLGFNDGYALAALPATADRYGLRRISDLAAHPDLRLGFTHEFIGRKDGWPGLARAYGLRMQDVRGLQHELAYEAIRNGQIDVMEIYTTDPQFERLGLRLLEDDRGFFPRYDAVLLYRLDLPRRAPRAFAAMERLVGRIDERKMIRANALIALEKRSVGEAAAALLRAALGTDLPAGVDERVRGPQSGWRSLLTGRVAQATAQHLQLVAVSLLGGILIGVPLGVLATRARWLAALTLSGSGLLQTIPSLALLALLIPYFGIGQKSALIALLVYSLLPIVRNTYVGMTTIPPNLLEAAEALGLSPAAQLFRVHLPLASPTLLAGIKTSAVINVGTATIAALIGAGGLGEIILQGISLVRTDMILQGAIPVALLALLVQGFFDLLDRLLIPRGLRLAR